MATNATPHFPVTAFQVQGKYQLSTNILIPLFAPYTGSDVSVDQILHAASALELAYVQQGYPNMNIVASPKQIKHGIVTLDAFPGAMAQVVVDGHRYSVSTNGVEVAINQPAILPPAALPAAPPLSTPTNASASTRAKDTGPRFTVDKYQVLGNTLLPPLAISQVLTNVPGAFGTNVSIDRIQEVVAHLGAAYRERGFATVYVGLPQQRLTNAAVKIQVIEGRLASIAVKGNKYFSTDNVLRSMPGLYTNMILNSLTFQAQLNQANANQDRQIYPVIEPGPDPGTSDLTLEVKDRLPLHAKMELNNESSPGTPDLRVNSSAVYNNLWQQDQSMGVQYSFSPEQLKVGHEWNFYDLPSVANYSTFYRIPLGDPDAIDDVIAANPGNFGYNEATRKFNLPPAGDQPALSIFASRSTIDTGIQTLSDQTIFSDPGVRSIELQTFQQDDTVNEDLGLRLNTPISSASSFHSTLTEGLDFKIYQLSSYKTNIFTDTEITFDKNNNPIVRSFKTYSPVPNPTNGLPVGITRSRLNYLPFAFRYDGSWNGTKGVANFGLGLNGNLWYNGSSSNLQTVVGSTKSTGRWISVNPSLSWQYPIFTNWLTTIRADGQVASEPLLSNEQFGAGGVNSVRGYHEGEVFGDDGWHVSLEQQTPPHTVGMVFGRTPLVVRGSLYMDYAYTYLLDPQGRAASTPLWGTGVGCVASVGSFWETRFLFSVPLLSTPTTQAYQPFFNFMLTAQF